MAEQAIEAGVMVLYEASTYSTARQAGVMVLHETAPAAARARVAGVMALYETSTYVAEATLDLLAGLPEQFYLIHDALAAGSSVVHSVSSQFGPRVGPPQAGDNNQGSILPSILGDPDDNTDTSLTLEIVRGGGLGTAEWAFSPENGEWYGYNDMLHFWGVHPVRSAANFGGVLVYSSVYRRIVVLTATGGLPGTGAVEIRHIDADARPQTNTDWSSASSLVPQGGVHATDRQPLAACELRDGSLLLAVRGFQISASDEAGNLGTGELEIYRSVNGGLTWVLQAERVTLNATIAAGLSSNSDSRIGGNGMLRMAASGDWVRMCYPNQNNGIASLVSADGGATWLLKTGDLDTDIIENPGVANNHDEQPFDLIGLDDNSGTFLIAFRGENGNALPQVYFGYASRDDDWIFSDLLNGASWTNDLVRSMCFVRSPSRIFLYVQQFQADVNQGEAEADDDWTVASVPRNKALKVGAWELQQQVNNLFRVGRYGPIQMSGTWVGDRGAILFYVEDGEGGADYAHTRPFLTWVGGWSGKPIAAEFPSARQDVLQWLYVYGVPAGLPSSASSTWAEEWSATLSAGGTFSHTVQGLVIESSAASDVAYQAYNDDPAFGTAPYFWDPDYDEERYYKLATRQVWEYVVAAGQTLGIGAPNVSLNIRIDSKQNPGNVGWNLQTRHSDSQMVLYDVLGGTPLLTLSGLDFGGSYEENRYYRFRLCVSPATTEPSFVIQARDETGGEWVEAGPVSLAAAAAAFTGIEARFGCVFASAGIVSRWREVRCAGFFQRTDYADPAGYTVPGDLAGAPTTVVPLGLGLGSTSTDPGNLKVGWSGGTGVVGDTYSWAMQHAHPAEHVFLDSPQYPWLTAVGATAGANFVLDARGSSGRPNRWMHNAIALFDPKGAETVIVAYAQDTAFSVGLTQQELSLVQHADIPITSSSGNVVGFSGSVVGATQIRDGALARKYLKITAETSGSGRVGHVHKVLRHWQEGDTHYVELSGQGQFDPDAILVGDTVSFLTDRYMHRWNGTDQLGKRYLRVTMGASDENNWDGRWGLSRLVVGMAKKFEPALQWQYSDTQTPDVTEVKGRSGAGWTYKNADPYRRIMGRWTGSINGEHRAFRDALDNLAGYQEQPIALLLDDGNRVGIENDLLLTRFDGSVGLDQQAWRMDTSHGNLRRPVGDMQVFFKEIL